VKDCGGCGGEIERSDRDEKEMKSETFFFLSWHFLRVFNIFFDMLEGV